MQLRPSFNFIFKKKNYYFYFKLIIFNNFILLYIKNKIKKYHFNTF